MSNEKYINFYSEENGTTVRKGQTASFKATGRELDLSKCHKLFVTGDTALFYQLKTEPDYPRKYRSIEDALDNDNAFKAQYCLNLSEKKTEKCIKRIYKRITFPPKISYIQMNPVPCEFDFGIFVKTENLSFESDGYLRLTLDIRYKKDGVSPLFAGDEPSQRIVIDIDKGTRDWEYMGKKVSIDSQNCVLCGYWIELYNYSGNVFLESPEFSAGGFNLVPDFTTPITDKGELDWTAQNISKKELPRFSVSINGCEIFNGEVFERCHLASEWSITIPQNLLTKEENSIDITYTSDYHDVLPYTFHELSFIEKQSGKFLVVAVTPVGNIGGKLPVLIKTTEDNVKASFSCPSGELCGKDEYTFQKAGLHGVLLEVCKAGIDVDFCFTCGTQKTLCTCPLLCIKEPDGVVVGNGDMIYIHSDKESFEEFLCWYLSNNCGNLLTMRPTYRWSGTKVFDSELWRDFARVLNELNIKYSLMVDGRELPGMDCNAPDDIIGGKGFLGRQMHERDGASFYWSVQIISSPEEIQFLDMGQRIFRERPEYSHTERSSNCFIYEDDKIYRYRSNNVEKDYKAAHDYSIERISSMRFDATRHTGPSVMFKSFIEAGYKKVGAETLYSSTEPLCAFLRGITEWRGGGFTVHHALQWGSTPHDRLDHTKRFRLALYVSYMQGAEEINTEEGLWRMEEAFSKFHRFTPCLKEHIQENADFYKYILSHTRKGVFHSQLAFIQGRYDGWLNFGNGRVWGLSEVSNGEAEASWDKCLSVMYPVSRFSDCLIFKNLIHDDRPLGYFTGTPLGNADVVPIETSKESLAKYPLLCFAGYHCAQQEDFNKLYSLCKNGAHLILTRAHFAKTTSIEKVREHDLSPLTCCLSFTDGDAVFEDKAYGGYTIPVCTNFSKGGEILERCDDGTPLLIKYKVDKGFVTLLNANVYPSNSGVCQLYTSYIEKCIKEINSAEKVFVRCKNDVQFTVYDTDSERHIYLLAVDWYNKSTSPRLAEIYCGENTYPVQIPYGVMIKAVAKDNVIIYPSSENGEVLSIEKDNAVLQGVGKVCFTICKDGKQTCIQLEFDKEVVKTVSI